MKQRVALPVIFTLSPKSFCSWMSRFGMLDSLTRWELQEVQKYGPARKLLPLRYL